MTERVTCLICLAAGDDGRAPCHPCADMPNGEILPGWCYGTMHDPHDMSRCLCGEEPDEKTVIVQRLAALEMRVKQLEEAETLRAQAAIPEIPFRAPTQETPSGPDREGTDG